MGNASVHPADQILRAFGLGKLDEVSSESVSNHLEGCDSCRRRVADLSYDDFLDRIQQAAVMPGQAQPGWSKSAASFTEEDLSRVAPLPAEMVPPELVDHPDYEIVRELGRGGMGVVYLANNKLMGRREVLKVVGRHLVERPVVLERFLREIRSAAKLQHTNIVTAYSAMRLGPSLVLAMEYVEGLDLAKMVKAKGPLPIAHACNFIHQAALGLQHAHERGMVHRDIKPANLILAREGKKAIVKVLDFGLAKVTSEDHADSSLTREGQVLGTPDYIAPEQIRDAQSADTRADIYSLGCTLYYLLTGRPPFHGHHLWDLYQAHFSMEAGALNLVRAEVPVELNDVVAKMMAKEPERRFQAPGDVARALAPFFKPQALQSPGPLPGPSRVETKVAPPLSSGAVAAPTQFATLEEGPGPAARRRQATEANRAASRSLSEFKQQGPSPSAVRPDSTEDMGTRNEGAVGRPRWLWSAVITASVVGVLAVGAVIHMASVNSRIKINEHPGNQAEARRPANDGAPVIGEPAVRADRGAGEKDRRAAEAVLSLYGFLTIRMNGQDQPVEPGGALPDQLFQLTRVRLGEQPGLTDAALEPFEGLQNLIEFSLTEAPNVTDAGVAFLRNLPRIERLQLELAGVTDAALVHLAQMPTLRWLDLRGTPLTDAGLAHIEGLKHLNSLSLGGSSVTDAGLAELEKLTHLKELDLSGTSVTPAGVEAIRKSLSACRIIADSPAVEKPADLLAHEVTTSVARPESPSSVPKASPVKPGLSSVKHKSSFGVIPKGQRSDIVLPGTVWVGERRSRTGPNAGKAVSYFLHIAERKGRTFSGFKYSDGATRNRVELVGQVAGKDIAWTERINKSVLNMRGSIAGNTIRIKFTGVTTKGAPSAGEGWLTFRATTNPALFDAVLSAFVPELGITTRAVGKDGLAILPEHFGRQAVLRTHPVNQTTPCILNFDFAVPYGKRCRLVLDVSHDARGDWNLLVRADGRTLHDSIVGRNTTRGGWTQVVVDLSQFAGQTLKLELLNQANDWRWEFGYWGQISMVVEDGTG